MKILNFTDKFIKKMTDIFVLIFQFLIYLQRHVTANNTYITFPLFIMIDIGLKSTIYFCFSHRNPGILH